MRPALALLLALAAAPACAQSYPPPSVGVALSDLAARNYQTADQVSATVTANRAVLPGVFTVAGLPSAANNQGRYAFVTNLGGGADMVLSDGTYWKHIRQGVVTDIAGGGPITVTPLISPPIMRITGSNLASTLMSIQTTNLYPGATYRIIIPGTLTALASFGVSVAGTGNTLSLVGASWQDVTWNGTALVKTAGGAL